MKKTYILYIGNNLGKESKYVSTIETLSNLLELEGYTVKTYSNKSNKLLRMLDMSWALIKHKKISDFVLIDTYSTTNFYYALIISQLARIFKLKYIPILHGGNLPFRLKKNSYFSKLIFKNSYKNIAPSNYLKYEFEKMGYKTVFIPNIIEINNYTFKERKKLNPNLLYVRAFDYIYNPIMAIKVLYNLKQTFPEAKLCMIGPFKDNSINKVKKEISNLKLTNSVEITGVLTKKEWHKKSEEFDIFINTTNFDNTPISVMEAMALGLPVVSTNAGGLPYLISDNFDGFLVDKNDATAMTNKIINLLNDTNLASKITLNARKKVEKFDWKFVSKQWNTILLND